MSVLFFKLALMFSLGIFVLPKKWKQSFGFVLHLIITICSSMWAIDALRSGETLTLDLGVSTWSGPMQLVIDPLSAFFQLIINFICVCGVIYAGGYLKPYIGKRRAAIISAHLFSMLWLHGSMLLVVSFRDGIAFLLAWELMSLFSFILVIFYGQKEHVLRTGINYLLQMHLCFALIMLGFLVAGRFTGELSFTSLQQYFEHNSNTGLFLFLFAGFGIKAGFIPLHTWLPHAHPAAPSHVSAIMSGVMIKMGIYGILRVTTYLQADWMTIGIWVLVFSMLSGILGVILAILQHDLKRLLAYHSIENIGIIGIGIAVAIIGKSYHDENLYVLGMAGALLHTLNHALFKSLLFFSAGNVFHVTHTVNMDHLGGLVKTMRYTSAFFLIGALAISGIPPFNGFISEFLIYIGLISNITTSAFVMSVIGISAILSLVLIGGLCVYCFTKAGGLTFLGTRRSAHTQHTHEVPFIMLLPAVLITTVIVSIGIIPNVYGTFLLEIMPVFHATVSSLVVETMSSTLQWIGIVNITLVTITLVLYFIRQRQQSRIVKASGPSWGCGYPALDYKHQYTPTSYAGSLREMIYPVVIFKEHYKPFAETEIFPQPKSYHTESKDLIEEVAVLTPMNFLIKLLPRAGVGQTGFIHHYLIYPLLFLVIIGLLTFLKVL